MTALSPFTRPRALRQFATLSTLFVVAGGLAWHGARSAKSVAKPVIEHALRSLEKNAAWAERGLVHRVIDIPAAAGASSAAGVRSETLRYLDVPSLAPPRRDRAPLPPLVFLHDSPGSSCEWVNVIFGGQGAADTTYDGLLEAQHSIRAFELPGHGVAPEAESVPSSSMLADTVAAALRALGGGPAILIGAGRGGEIAVRVAALAPELVAKLVLLSPTGIAAAGSVRGPGVAASPDDFDADAYREVSVDGVRRSLAISSYRAPTDDEVAEQLFVRQNARNWATAVGLALEERDRPDRLAAILPRVTQPVLLVFGSLDRRRPVGSYGQRFAAALPNARLATIDACGSRPHVECPDRVIKVIDGFR